MTTFTLEIETAGPCLSSLQRLQKDGQRKFEWLVIAHNDPKMVRRLTEAMDDKSAALLQIPQNTWGLISSDLADSVTWSIREANAKHLLLIGHSHAGLSDQSASWIDNADNSPNRQERSSNRLLEGVNRVQQQIQRSKDDFTRQVNQLCENDELQNALTAGSLQLHALFFIAQTDAFLAYDIKNQSFHPIHG